MVKETKRKTFKFYRSYYDMFNELDKDKDKLAFITAVLDKQFLGIDPDLKGITKFAYISQIHSIEKQVKGWQDATGEELTGAYAHPLTHPLEGTPKEEEVKEKEEVEVKEKDKVEEFKNSLRPHVPKYGVELITKFFDYWSETNTNGKKMRFEYAKNQPFNIDRRLSTWSGREQSFKPKQKQDRL